MTENFPDISTVVVDHVPDTLEEEVYVFPTSFAQQRLWFLDQFEPNSPFYNIPTAIRFRGSLDVAAFERSIQETVRRHETLRTTFAAIDGKPVQIIHPSLQVQIPIINLRHMPASLREQEIMRLASEEARQPFNLSRGPLVRVTLLCTDEKEHIVLLTMHHIISDGWSMGVLVREIAVLYEAFSQGKPSPLAELTIQYGDFAEWQQQYIAGEVLEKQINYWKKKLGGNAPVLELPTDRPRPAVQTYRGATESMMLPKDLLEAIKSLSRKEGATLFMTLLAAFQTLLYRYTGQEDICVGSPIANRTRAEIEALIGFFVNTLVLRTDLSGDPTFRELLARVREVTLEAYANQDVPFEKLVEVLQPERDMSHSSLFQFMFILQNAPMRLDVKLPDVYLSSLDVSAGTSTYDLTLMITEQADGLLASVEYNTDLFDASTVGRILGHYQRLLEEAVANPNEKLSRLTLVSASERQQLLVDFNNFVEDYATDVCIHHLFAQQAARTPEAKAVAYEGTYLTYSELNRRANQLAHHLQKLGVGPETLIGICLEKSLDLIVAVLGTLKAGGAYIPIDPDYPAERVAYMLEDARVSALLTLEKLLASLPTNGAKTICLDSDWPQIAEESDVEPISPVVAENLAYVIYTSGSTGKSKGTMISHASLVNAYLAWEQEYGLRSGVSSHLQMASFSFDVFTGDFVRALCSGGKLVLCPREVLLDGAKLYDLMVRENVDCAEFVPAVLRNLVQFLEESGNHLGFMKNLIAGSDIWYVGEYKKFLAFCAPETRLINSFGLTEATIDSSYFEGSVAEFPEERLVPIGHPFPNTKLFILDQNLQLAPVGVPGELFVAGINLARGYLRRPELTAEKFIPHPFSEEPGARLYRTGDLARFLADGNIEFLGRIDFQVKVRGYRIELGEIESILSKHPMIQDAVVVAREESGGKRLVAYLISQNGLPSPLEMRNFLKDQLPDYMLPSAYVFLDALPLTPNGKVDRRALPPPEKLAAEPSVAYVAPFTPTQEVIAGIWAKVLGKERVGVYDNFFELGGHSLLATQVISRVREAFKVEFPLRGIFESPTVAEFAKAVDLALLAKDGVQLPAIERIPRDGELPLSFAQQRLWFLDQLEPNSPFYNIPDAVRISGALNTQVLEQSLNEVVKRHESLRTSFKTVAGNPVQVIAENLYVPLRQIDLIPIPAAEQWDEVLRLAAADAQQPFDLAVAPLFRVTLLRLDEQDHVILLTMHHIISDDWSSVVLIQELAALYDAFSKGQPSPLAELPIQYADYASWQQEYLRGEVMETQLSYWKKKLAGLPPLLSLPTDRPRPPVQTFKGAYQTFVLSDKLSKAIKELGRAEGTTLFMTLLAAFQTLLFRYSGETDLAIGSPIANRTRAEIERLIGFFVNTLVFRTDLSGNPSFRKALKRVRETALEAYAHQDVPFEKLVDALQPKRNLSHPPLFQVMFALQNTPRQVLTQPGLTLSPVEAHSGTAKFDLTLFMLEQGDQLGGALEYNTDLFDSSTIARMIQHFQRLLESIVTNPDQTISALPILTEAEQSRLLREWNDTQLDYAQKLPVHRAFAQQVERTPDAVAASFGEDQLTYLELNQRANQLGHYLRKSGVGADDLVGVFLDPSLEMLVALLGILKAGGAYVPIDTSWPEERIAYTLADSGVKVLLTQEHSIPDFGLRIADFSNLSVLRLDADWPLIAQEAADDFDSGVTEENLAYVIYTSGSTGKPKGTLITHKGLTNYLNWCLQAYPVGEGKGSLVHSTIAFDATVTGLFAPLLVGRTVKLVAGAHDVEALSAALRQEGDFSLIKITPAHLELLSHQLPPEQGRGRTRAFIIGGENLTADQIAFWQEHAPETLLVNEYGPTETVVGCVVFNTPTDWKKPGSIPIGKPIPNTRIYLLDEGLNPVPVGVPGEMYIGGDGVARGYLHRPDLTAERFVPDPFAGEPGARLYRTGDLVKYLADGNMEFLGRIDHQVKIRGFRIELGEIEAVLGKHPALREVVVVARESEQAGVDKRLVAYVVPAGETVPAINELRGYLQEKLPQYMIPSFFVKLDALPLTPNGKVDRKALPAPTETRSEMLDEFVAPRTPTEELLAETYGKVLGVSRVSIRDNFFEIGGHSLLATQLMSRIRDVFEVELPLRAIFEAPTVAELSKKIQTAKQQIQTSVPPLRPIPRGEGTRLPLSFGQQRLWFLDQLEPGNHSYNIPAAIRFVGHLDVSAFSRSLSEVVRRHEVLRTSFSVVDGEPVQVVAPEGSLTLRMVDLSALAEAEKETEALRLAREEAKQPFALSLGPLLRASLLRLGEEEHILLLTLHHIISDGWSMAILVQEVAALYEAFSLGQPSPLVDLPIQYADFSYWQRQWLQGEILEAEIAYWQKQLAGSSSVLQLPTDRPRPAVKTFRGSLKTFELSPELTSAIRELGRQEGVTLFMTLMAAFQTLLYRYSGQEDISVGTPIANRNRSETEALIGFFVNTLVIRTDLSGEPSFKQLLHRVRETALDAYAHQDVPFEKLVEALQPERDLSHTPLFQVMLVLQNTPMQAQELPGLRLQPLEVDSGTVQYDLVLSLREEVDRLSGALEFNTDLFEGDTVERMLGHFKILLQGLVAAPEQSILSVPLLPEAEQHQVLEAWNDTVAEYPRDRCIHQLFEAQVERTPEAIALVFAGEKVTYQQLNRRANQLAHHLRKLSIGPEVLVGVCVDRSIEMVVGLLGILKAGGAYVPLDPSYPAERLAYMLEDSGVQVLLTQQRLISNFGFRISENNTLQVAGYKSQAVGLKTQVAGENPQSAIRNPQSEIRNPKVVCLDSDWPEIAQESEENPDIDVSVDNLAYMIFTSGSTGRPKGVMLRHRGLNNLTTSQIKDFNVHAQSRVLQFASFSFDASVSEIFMALLTGATLYLAPREVLMSPPDLLRLFREERITTVTLPPSVLRVLPENDLPSLETIISAGERCSRDLAERWSKGRRFLNAYGPTEATIGVSSYLVDEMPANGISIPIGRPIANTQLYILDQRMNPAPIGVIGELYIGGVGLARGYRNLPDLTAEKFVPNPFSKRPGARLYRTGDLARFFDDGNIEFLGRIDHQVKVRGFRIELGEVEAVLREHPALREAVVIAKESKLMAGESRLIAYLVSQPDQVVTTSEARDYLRERLPEYMIPSAFVVLEALPLTPNGKIDRRALPEPDQSAQSGERTYIAPRTPEESIIVALWQQILQVEQIGVSDNFFDLGGHSLLATQLVSRLRDAFHIDLPLAAIFEASTVAELAQKVQSAMRAAQGVLPPEIQPVSREEELPLSFAQQRLWYLDQLEPNSPLYNLPSVVRLTGTLHLEILEKSLQEIVQRHEILRTVFAMENGRPRQVIQPRMQVSLTVEDLRTLSKDQQDAEAMHLAMQEALQPFDLSAGPLLRTRLVRLADDEHIFLLTMHHIVADGWSMGIFVQEVAALYNAFLAGKPSPLPELRLQYADFAHWQRQWLRGDVLEAQLSYWKQRLSGSPPLLELPTDRPRPAVQSFRGKTLAFALPAELANAVRHLSQEEGATLFMTVLAAFNVLLFRYSGQDDINVGTAIANRNQRETEGLIGFFVNTLVMRTNLFGEPSFRELLRRVRQTSLEAYAHQDLPFEMLVDALNPVRNMSHSPLFQVMFVFQNAPLPTQQLTDLKIVPTELQSGLAKFDLTLSIIEAADGLAGSFEYNTDLFDEATIARMIGHFGALLENIVAHPDCAISELPFLSEAEAQQIIVHWNDTKAAYPSDSCVHELFLAQVERTPEAPAVYFENQQLSYRQLNAQANRLANYLQKLGIQTEDRVGLCVERSLEMIIGILGIMKAGGAYLPLDPTYPPERLQYMLEDSRVSVMLTKKELLPALGFLNVKSGEKQSTTESLKIISLDDGWPTIAKESKQEPKAAVTAENLAYIIYTSGSTGRPKGVMLQHRGLCNLTQAQINDFQVHRKSRVLQFASFGFDASVSEIFMALLSGAALYLPSREIITSFADLLQYFREKSISVVTLPPSVLRLLPNDNLPDLRTIISAGENCTADLAEKWSTGRRFLNAYGPTEATVGVTSYWVHGKEKGRENIPIGRPMHNTQLYILDAHMNPVPIGVMGELFIGGVGLARGYNNRADLTAEKFIPHPFSAEPGSRLYRTGDFARFLPDGNIEFIGRVDFQVKVRGFRIELGEIEDCLRQHPLIKDAAVMTKEFGSGKEEKRLIAYLVPAQKTVPASDELQKYLKEKLPEYMIPSLFVPLDALPLTPNGKVNRQALPDPIISRTESLHQYLAPHTETEKILAQIWQQILGVERIGIKDNFFEIGGDSLLSIQVVALANQAGLALTPKLIMQHPFIEDLAVLAQHAEAAQVEPQMDSAPFPLTPIQLRFLEQHPVEMHHFNTAMMLEVVWKPKVEVLQKTVQQLMKHHDSLRTSFVRSESGWQGITSNDDLQVPFYYYNLSRTPLRQQKQEIEAIAASLQTSFDVTKAPLFRVAYFNLGVRRAARLLIVFHHLITDAFSWRIFLGDFISVYKQLSEKGEAKLPAKTTSYQTFARHLRQYAENTEMREDLQYWLKIGESEPYSIPVDNPNGENTYGSSDNITFSLKPQITKTLLQRLPKAKGAQINEVLLTALLRTFAQWTGKRHLLIQMDGHGREEILPGVNLSKTMGWFTTSYPVLLNLGSSDDLEEQLEQIKAQLRSVPNHGFNHGVLRYLYPDGQVRAQLKDLPEPEVNFNYLGQFDQAVSGQMVPIKIAKESVGVEQSPKAARPAKLYVVGIVSGRQLHIRWLYSRELHKRSTIEWLANNYVQELEKIGRLFE